MLLPTNQFKVSSGAIAEVSFCRFLLPLAHVCLSGFFLLDGSNQGFYDSNALQLGGPLLH